MIVKIDVNVGDKFLESIFGVSGRVRVPARDAGSLAYMVCPVADAMLPNLVCQRLFGQPLVDPALT